MCHGLVDTSALSGYTFILGGHLGHARILGGGMDLGPHIIYKLHMCYPQLKNMAR
jgi:hypothetical protein